MTTGEQAPAVPSSPPARRWTGFVWKGALVIAVGAGGLWTATHGVAGVAWTDVAGVLRGVPVDMLVLLAAIWLGGLGIYSLVLAAALPGLGIRRSLLLNLSGSAVANIVPLGGAVATALNWRMVRVWGHSNLSFVAFCVLTNALDVMTKLVLPIVAVVGLALLSVHVPAVLWGMAAACASVLLAVAVAHPFLLRDGDADADAATDRRLRSLTRRYLHDSGTRIRRLLVTGWAQLLPATFGYISAQVALLFFSLQAVGLHASITTVLMAAAIERLGTLVPLTPGGTGIAEIGTIAWLVAVGLDPVEVVAGVLLYRIFLIAMEIPLGGVLLAGWAWSGRRGVGGATA